MSLSKRSLSMLPAIQRVRTAPRKLTSTIRALEPWKYPKSLHQGKNEKNGIAEAIPFLSCPTMFSYREAPFGGPFFVWRRSSARNFSRLRQSRHDWWYMSSVETDLATHHTTQKAVFPANIRVIPLFRCPIPPMQRLRNAQRAPSSTTNRMHLDTRPKVTEREGCHPADSLSLVARKPTSLT